MKISKKKKDEIKNQIEMYELNHMGLRHHSGAFIIVRNLRLTKKLIKCDILAFHGEDNYMERYNDIEYPTKDFIKEDDKNG